MSDETSQPQASETVQQPEVAQPGPPSAPYRDAPPPVVAMTSPRASAPEALWGPVLMVFGVLLWGFVVMGQLTTTFTPDRHGLLLGEASAVLFVMGTTVAAWIAALRRSVAAFPPTGMSGRVSRGFAVGCLPVIGLGLALVFAMIVGKALSHSDGMVTILLLAVAGGAFAVGRRMSGGAAKAPESPMMVRVLWGAAGVVTFAAIVALAAS